MRIAFLLVILAGGVFYSHIAFAELDFLTRTGRLGPGFFPRVIGAAIVAATIWALLDALRARAGDDAGSDAGAKNRAGWRDVVTVVALALGYALALRLLGGFAATFVYLAAALTILNRGRHPQNAAIAVAVPTGIYLVFDRLLNANMPPGLLDLPI